MRAIFGANNLSNVMKQIALLLYAAAMTLAALWGLRHYRQEVGRLQQNQTALAAEVTHYRTRAGAEAASTQALRLRCAEYEQLRADDARRIRELGIRIRRLEAAATLVSAQQTEATAPLRDTVVGRPAEREVAPALDTVRVFRWSDAWCSVEGTVRADSVTCRIACVDTLRQIVHRIPHKFLFFRWGTKALRQEIVPANPHTRVIYAEYVQIAR